MNIYWIEEFFMVRPVLQHTPEVLKYCRVTCKAYPWRLKDGRLMCAYEVQLPNFYK